MVTLSPALRQEYEQLYATLEIKSDRVDDADNIINRILNHKAEYKTVERETGVPWFFIAAIHSLESSLNFNTHLHNGDPLTAKTVHVPAGRPPGNPPFTWTESAIDALEYNGTANWNDWGVAGTCYSFEKYNGWGYRIHHPEVKSPYLWSFSNHYTKGKYVADGHFDPNAVSQQCGGMVLLKRMEQRGLISFDGTTPNQSPVTWLELYRKEENGAISSVVAGWAGSELIEAIELKDRSTEDLADFLRKYPTAKTFHIASSSKPVPAPTLGSIIAIVSDLPTLTRILRWGDKGDDVKALQRALNRLGFNAGAEDGDFGDQTEAAVKAYQLRKGLQVDGEVGAITWKALGGEFSDGGGHQDLGDFASAEAAKGLRWNGASSEAEKYLEPLRPIMQQLGHIGTAPVFYDWCAAFVTYCCRQVGIAIPDKPEGFWASMALVASWEYWAKQQGYWHPAGTTKPKRGDIVTFDWGGVDGRFNHIGIVRGYTPGSSVFNTAEGNVGNRTAHKSRSLSLISGIVRIR
jgi:lysozyme family protein